MKGAIFLLQGGGLLVEMRERAYDSEAILQQLLAKHPNLLAGDQINSAAPRRWLLIAREISVPSTDDGAGRWYLDHLFLDQDGIPTLVEVKRSSDTRIRREVVGQMLDYAANAVVYWPMEKLRSQHALQCAAQGSVAEDVLRDFLGPEADLAGFWQTVETNLRAGRVRLIFVADEIPAELRRVIEFLNKQMNPATVLGVEVRQYASDELRTLVPRVIGQTAETEVRKDPDGREKRQWDEASFLKHMEAKNGPAQAAVARRIVDWARQRELRLTWGRGTQDGSFIPAVDQDGESFWPIAIYTYGRVEVQFQYLKVKAPFADESMRLELLRKLNEIPGVIMPDDAISRRPRIDLATLTNAAALEQFLGVLDWVLAEITANTQSADPTASTVL